MSEPLNLEPIKRRYLASWTAGDYLPDTQERLLDEAKGHVLDLLAEVKRLRDEIADQANAEAEPVPRQIWEDSKGRRSYIRPDQRGVVEITMEALTMLMKAAGLHYVEDEQTS